MVNFFTISCFCFRVELLHLSWEVSKTTTQQQLRGNIGPRSAGKMILVITSMNRTAGGNTQIFLLSFGELVCLLESELDFLTVPQFLLRLSVRMTAPGRINLRPNWCENWFFLVCSLATQMPIQFSARKTISPRLLPSISRRKDRPCQGDALSEVPLGNERESFVRAKPQH